MKPLTLRKLTNRKVLFVGGKGGVGKTTTAAALGMLAADRGMRCLVVSTDPAHSLGDAFDREIGDKVTGLTAGLWGLEIDPDAQAARHLDTVTEHMKQLAAPEMHREVERQMQMARMSPGAVEAALLEEVSRVMLEGSDEYDLVVFDTAPTGHTLRLLTLPEAMAAWTDGLLAHNKRSEELGKVLKHLTPSGSRSDVPTPFDEPDQDPFEGMDRRTRRIAETLLNRRRLFHRARRVMTNPDTTGFVFVLTPERLPILETHRAMHALQQFDIPLCGAIINRVLPADADGEFLRRRREQEARYLAQIPQALHGLETVQVPMLPEDIQGMRSLSLVAAELDRLGL
ncbi:MAG: ArsA family ATPase [Ectothiorhodospiraceae bacterium]|nr:ArsA family ATPase [Ectothiorhodospiraceae bacterium]